MTLQTLIVVYGESCRAFTDPWMLLDPLTFDLIALKAGHPPDAPIAVCDGKTFTVWKHSGLVWPNGFISEGPTLDLTEPAAPVSVQVAPVAESSGYVPGGKGGMSFL